MALRISKHRRVVLELRRSRADHANKLVYIITANKRIKYRGGSRGSRSSIVYVGTTKRGIQRIMSSVAGRAWLLYERGIRKLEVHLVTCKARAGVATWIKLERAILIVFKELYGELPYGNSLGHRLRKRDEFRKYFRHDQVVRLIESFDV